MLEQYNAVSAKVLQHQVCICSVVLWDEGELSYVLQYWKSFYYIYYFIAVAYRLKHSRREYYSFAEVFHRINMYITWKCIGIIWHQWDNKLRMLLKIPNNLCKIFTVSFVHVYKGYKMKFTTDKMFYFRSNIWRPGCPVIHSSTGSYYLSVLQHLTGDHSGYWLMWNYVIYMLQGYPGWPLLS